MDVAKRKALITRLAAEPAPQIVAIDTFFDGNDDLGSIGCNLIEHPGIEVFRAAFARLARQPGVAAIFGQIAELDPGEGCWPFVDTVFVVGSIPTGVVARELVALQPDEIRAAAPAEIPAAIAARHRAAATLVWWD